MFVVCSFCRKNLGEKAPFENRKTTHGMCSECHDTLTTQLEGQSFDEYLGSFQFPVLIVDAQGRLLAANGQAMDLIEQPLEKIQGFLGGEALECVYARYPEGCGNTVHCTACTIRNLVQMTSKEKNELLNRRVTLTTEGAELEMIVSTHYRDGLVRLVIQEIVVVPKKFVA